MPFGQQQQTFLFNKLNEYLVSQFKRTRGRTITAGGKRIKQVGQTDVASEFQQLEPCQITIFEYLNSAFVCACQCVSVWLSVRKVYTICECTLRGFRVHSLSALQSYFCGSCLNLFLTFFTPPHPQKAHHCPLWSDNWSWGKHNSSNLGRSLPKCRLASFNKFLCKGKRKRALGRTSNSINWDETYLRSPGEKNQKALALIWMCCQSTSSWRQGHS